MNKTTSTAKLHNNDLHVENCYYCMIENKNKDVDFLVQNMQVSKKKYQKKLNRAEKKLNTNETR